MRLRRRTGPEAAPPARPAGTAGHPPAGEGTGCGSCEAGELQAYEMCQDHSGTLVEIRQCLSCGVLTNMGAYEASDAEAQTAAQADGLDVVYADMIGDVASVRAGVEANRSMLDVLLEMSGLGTRSRFLDIGAGAGHMSLAACSVFRDVVSVDLRPDLLEASASLLGRPSNLTTAVDLDAVTPEFDCIFMWHVLEHVPNSAAFLRQLRALLSDGGALLLQVPAYRPEHVMPAHHHHHNARSLRYLADQCGFASPSISYDVGNGFITALMRATDGT